MSQSALDGAGLAAAARPLTDALGLPGPAYHLPASPVRFPDGGSWRVEIPSVEGPRALEAVLETSADLGVPVHRVSQGSGVFMLTDAEIDAMVEMCRAADVQLCLFLGPRASWDTGVLRASPAGRLGARVRGGDGLRGALLDARRAVDLGVRSLLVADDGVLWSLHQLRAAGGLPADLQLKVSVLSAPANPVAMQVQERLGADSVNVPADLSLAQLAEMRAVSATPFDFYVESPDNVGGCVRLYDIPELVRVAAPVYLKFGLTHAPDVYPAGQHLAATVEATSRERVRRARLGIDLLERLVEHPPPMSPLGCHTQPAAQRFTAVTTPEA